MEINTKRLSLRCLCRDDAPWIAHHIADPDVQCWLTSPPRPYARAHADDFVARHIDNPEYRLIELGGEAQGIVSLARHEGRPIDLGYWLARNAWGQGIMTEAASALVAWHFNRSDDLLLSGWIRGNDASCNVLGKLGFQPHGSKQARSEFHDRDVTVDKVILTKDRWQALSAGR